MGRQEGGRALCSRRGEGGVHNPKSHRKEPPKDVLCRQEKILYFLKNGIFKVFFVGFLIFWGGKQGGGSIKCPAGGGFGLYPSGGG